MSPESTCLQTLEVGIWVGVGQGKTYGKSFWPCGTLGHTTHSRSALLLCSTCKATGDKFVCPLLLNSTGNNEVNGESAQSLSSWKAVTTSKFICFSSFMCSIS